MAAPMTAAVPRMAPDVPPLSKHDSMMPSLVKKPENGGIPMMAR